MSNVAMDAPTKTEDATAYDGVLSIEPNSAGYPALAPAAAAPAPTQAAANTTPQAVGAHASPANPSATPSPDIVSAAIVAAAEALGFHRVAILEVTPPYDLAAYQAWLTAGLAADMHYLSAPAHLAPRQHPARLMPTAQTLISVVLAYDRARHLPIIANDGRLRGQIARYAAGTDYHLEMRDRLVALARAVADRLGVALLARPCVDSAPLLERAVAQRGQLGFIGKNTMLITPGLGSFTVLGELLIDLAAAPTPTPTAANKAYCGSCTACLTACPTGAFVGPYQLDARACISYVTIEHRGYVPLARRAQMGTWIFGCDICQQVCPYNAGKDPRHPVLPMRDVEHRLPDLVRLVTFGANQLRQFVKRTALRRAPREQILRNVAIALGNTGEAAALAPLQHLLQHARPLVRGHAAWGLGQLASLCDDAALRATIRDTLATEQAHELRVPRVAEAATAGASPDTIGPDPFDSTTLAAEEIAMAYARTCGLLGATPG